MKRVLLVLCVTILLVLCVLTTGCQEVQQGRQSGDKRARLVSVENATLKEQVKSLQLHLQQQKDLVADCEHKAIVKAQAQTFDEALLVFLEELAIVNQSLTAENGQLKAEIAELKSKAD